MPSTFEQTLTKVVNDTNAYKTEYSKLPAAVKAKDNNYRNAVSMIYEAQQIITGLKDQIKKGSQTAIEDMKKWQANYPKVFARIQPCADEVAKLKKDLDDLKTDVFKAQKTADQLNQEAARSAMQDVRAAATQLKTVLADLKTLAAAIDKQLDFLSGLPKAPNGVFV
jgi:chromosome segregation ATPase